MCCLWPIKSWNSQRQSYKAAGNGESGLHPCFLSNPRGFRHLLFYLYRELGGGICITWAQTQPRAVAKWEAEPHRRQSTTNSHNRLYLFEQQLVFHKRKAFVKLSEKHNSSTKLFLPFMSCCICY